MNRPTFLKPAGLLLLTALLCGCNGGNGDHNGRPAEIAAEQWNRLKTRWLRRAEPVVEPQAAVEAPSPEPVEVAPAAPERLPRSAMPDGLVAAQMEVYSARRPKSVLENQPFRRTQTIEAAGPGGLAGRATLVNLNPEINAWYVLSLDWGGSAPAEVYHLVNERPRVRDLELDPSFPVGVVIADTLERRTCDLWSAAAAPPLVSARAGRFPYASLCDGAITLRLRTEGRKTALESVTDFLRDNVWQGEAITVFIRQSLFQDKYLKTGDLNEANVPDRVTLDGPPPARLDSGRSDLQIAATGMGLSVESAARGRMVVGRWHPLRELPGVFVSALQPDLVAPEILAGHRDVVAALDEVERGALVYLVAFELERFEIGFAVGTDHPRVGWSDRALPTVRSAGMDGPDGFGSISPLVATGVIGPSVAPRAVATFTGGFKRSHGAFKAGDLALQNQGSHYGFIENGAILSKLQPGLATVYVLDDGSVGMRTWARADDDLLPRIAFARQNGVPLLEPDPETGEVVPGRLVSRWAFGNWSGSHDGKFRTLRAGLCLQEAEGRRFLTYGYFSGATPSAMVRVFQAYDCRYAMLMDMNALEHTYLAVYRPEGGSLVVEHLIDEMKVLDQARGEELLPRFLGFADNRDFFYLLRREETR